MFEAALGQELQAKLAAVQRELQAARDELASSAEKHQQELEALKEELREVRGRAAQDSAEWQVRQGAKEARVAMLGRGFRMMIPFSHGTCTKFT